MIYYTTTEAADLLGVTMRRIQALLNQGRFPGSEKFGRDWQIPSKALDGFTRKTRGKSKKKSISGKV